MDTRLTIKFAVIKLENKIKRLYESLDETNGNDGAIYPVVDRQVRDLINDLECVKSLVYELKEKSAL